MIDFRCREAAAGLISYWTSTGSVNPRGHELLRQLTKRFSLIVSVERLNALLRVPGQHKGEIEEALAKLVDADPSADKLVADYLDQKPLEFSLLRYVDFAVRFGPQVGDSHPVCVTSPAGEGRGRFRVPIAEEADRVLQAFSAGIRTSSSDQLRDLKSATVGHEIQCGATEIGGQLFRALIRDQLRELFEESLSWLSGRDGFGLRLKLHLAPRDARQARLAALPWEFMYRRERQTFLSLSRKTPIVRYLDVPPGVQASATGSPVRVLVVMSSPIGEELLDLACERDRLERELATRRGVKVKVLDEATIEGLHDELLSQPYDVFHFMGHGTFDEATGVGGLVFEDGRGQARMVPASILANALRDMDRLRLVVLNACNSARAFYVNGCNPFAGVANALVLAGLPAVVAMQFPMSDRAAIVFSAALYRRLAAGDPIDAATVQGRLAVHFDADDSQEWGTPVLYMRVPDDRLTNLTRV